jgi:hypothetical protein
MLARVRFECEGVDGIDRRGMSRAIIASQASRGASMRNRMREREDWWLEVLSGKL